MAVAAPPLRSHPEVWGRRPTSKSWTTSRTGFTALGWGFTGTANPGIGAEGFRRKTSPFDGENCLRSALRCFLGGRFNFVDKSDFPANFPDLAAVFEALNQRVVISAFVLIECLGKPGNLAQFRL
jgi:hypothetical protein